MSRIGVVGFGTMGSEIALVAACAGFQVTVVARDEEKFNATKARLGKILRLLSRDQNFFARESVKTDEQREEIMSAITRTAKLAALKTSEIVIESMTENFAMKVGLFHELGGVCPSSTILASNTSSLRISDLASHCDHQERVIGMHFFNPVTQMRLVEVAPHAETSSDTLERAMHFLVGIDKRPVEVKDSPGFVLNRVSLVGLLEAITLLEEEQATAVSIDEIMKLGAGMPMGPLKLADKIGLDVCLATCDNIYRETSSERFHAPAMLRRMVEEGSLGKKSGKGFYTY